MKPDSRLYLLFIFFLCYTVFAFSQASVVESANYGGSDMDEGIALYVQDSNRVILGGRSFSDDVDVPGNFGGSDFWVSVLNQEGEFVWSEHFGGFNNDDLARVAVNSIDQVIAFGTTRSDDGNLQGIFGAWLVGLHPNGQMLWSATYGGYIGETGVDLYVHDDDDISILVKASSPYLYGDSTNGVFDFWLAKLNPVGTRQWSKVYGGDDSDIPTKLVKVPNGYLLCGYSNSESGDVSENKGGFDYWMIRVDNQGELLWERNYGGSDDDRAYDAIAMPNGDFIIIGESESADGDKTVSFGDKDVWMIRINSDGDIIWQRTYGGTDNDIGRRVMYEGPGKLYFAAHTNSNDIHLRGNKGLYDYWFVETDEDGVLQYQMNYGGTKDEFVADMVQDNTTGIIYLSGSSESENGNVSPDNHGGHDAWILQLKEATEECDVNLDCFVEDLGHTAAILYPVTNENSICDEGCTVGSQGGPPLSGPNCPTAGIKSAWYKIRTDDEAQLMSFSILSSEFNDPRVAVLASTNCNQFTQIACGTGEDGLLVMENIPIEGDTAYYIVIGDGTGLTGTFQLCVNTIDVQFCNLQDRIYPIATSLGSPLNGPYKPGEDVTLCYELTLWQKLDCNGLQGIVPSFGPGWDSTNFDIFGMPKDIDSMVVPIADGFWDWYSLADVHYNFNNPEMGYQGGQGLPAGWYFVNENGVPPNDEPDNSIGDIIHCNPDSSIWKVCFTLTTKSFCEENLECSVTVKTFADGEVGENVSMACRLDIEETFESTLACCLSPNISQISNFTICSGDSVNVSFESNLIPPVLYTWEAESTGDVIGASEGQGVSLKQELINLSDEIQQVTYTVSAVNAFCTTPEMIFNVSVRPNPTASLSLSGPNSICEGQMTWLRVDLTGTPPFLIQLAQNSVPQDVFLTEEFQTFIPVEPTVPSVYGIVSIEDMHCQGSAQGAVNINVKDSPHVILDETICEGETFFAGGSEFTFPGEYNIILEGEAANGCDSTIFLDLKVLQTSQSLIDTVLCLGESITVGKIPFNETGTYEIVLEAANGCDSTVLLFLEIVTSFIDSTSQTVCFGNSVLFRGDVLSETGVYFDSVPITPFCDSVYILDLTVLSQIQLSETVILPDTGQSTGAILVEFQGSLPPYSYQWEHGSTLEDQTDLSGGDYFLTVTDAIGCSAEFQFFIPTVSAVKELSDLITVEVWPNPVSSYQQLILNVRNDRTDIRHITTQLYTIDGVVAGSLDRHQIQSGNQHVPINLLPLVPGLYLLKVANPELDAETIFRIVIE